MNHIAFDTPGPRGTVIHGPLCGNMELGDRLAVGKTIPDCPYCIEIQEEEFRLERAARKEMEDYL